MASKTNDNNSESTHDDKVMKTDKLCRGGNNHYQSSAIYGLGLIGAAVYFIGQATSLSAGVIGFLKALVWPAFLVYYALKSFGL